MNFLLLAGAVAALLLLIFEVPKWITGSYLFEPLRRATYSAGTESAFLRFMMRKTPAVSATTFSIRMS